jgi:hypothetical protein
MSFLTISARAMGKRKPLVPDWQVPWPHEEHDPGEPLTLRQLITRIVFQEVEGFKIRQEALPPAHPALAKFPAAC